MVILRPYIHLFSVILKMKQWITRQNGLDELQLQDVPNLHPPGDDEVLVKIHAVSLNYRDTEGETGYLSSIKV